MAANRDLFSITVILLSLLSLPQITGRHTSHAHIGRLIYKQLEEQLEGSTFVPYDLVSDLKFT